MEYSRTLAGAKGRGGEGEIRVAVIARYSLIREAIGALLGSLEGVRVENVFPYPTGDESLRAVARVDVVVLMVSRGERRWLDLVGRVRCLPLAPKVVLLSVYNDPSQVQAALCQGAQGYVWYDDDPIDLRYALRSVVGGGQFISPAISAGLLGESAREPGALTRREGQVLSLIADGCTNKEIARRLVVSVKTVDTHRTRIMRKLNLHTTAALVRFALEEGIAREANV